MPIFIVSPDAPLRVARALEFLNEGADDARGEVLVVGTSYEAVDDLARAHAFSREGTCGVHRATLDRLATRLALPTLASRGLVPASRLAFHAVVARTVFLLHAAGALRYFGPVGHRPGFPAAVALTLSELRMQGILAAELPACGAAIEDLARIAERFERELAESGLADRATVYQVAIEAAAGARYERLLLLDARLRCRLERDLVRALTAASGHVFASAAAGDTRSITLLGEALGATPEALEMTGNDALHRLKRHLFTDDAPPMAAADATLAISSWPGESRECVEIVRAIQREAAAGRPFDHMAVLLRAPDAYRSHLEEAFARAEIPAFFAGGVRRPHPSGRAMLALLACAAERLSARRFAEYLSLGQVPHPAPSPGAEVSWQPPRHDMAPLDGAFEAPPEVDADTPPAPIDDADPDAETVIDGTLRAPWRWERLIVEAAVLGGAHRWARRLQGLREQVAGQRALVDDADEAKAAALDRRLADIAHLQAFALPLMARLDALPREATWGEWLPALQALATHALGDPRAVLETLAELEPLAPIGPVDLDEVRLVLDERLRGISSPPPRRRLGRVFVAPIEAARGMAFDVVFVPGLVESVFPQPVVEDPILLDGARRALQAVVRLDLQEDRAAEERLALRLAAGAARQCLRLSYPRVDAASGRLRVPSFYALASVRAAEGTLLGFETLRARLAEHGASARLGWPAPECEQDAIDAAEYDLALVARLLGLPSHEAEGAASYLLTVNPHLGRALRLRWRRGRPRWSRADGLDLRDAPHPRDDEVAIDALARAALARHQIDARSFSPTALQHYAVCPYRFFLQAVQRLAPREPLETPEVLDPLTRGSIFHEVQFETLSRLRARGVLPVTPATLDEAIGEVDEVLTQVAAQVHDRLAPPIERVWEDDVAALRADLREWLRRAAYNGDGWTPYRFELSFGLPAGARDQADPNSIADPVLVLDRLRLRGAIDLVERNESGRLRATDHKTGKAWGQTGLVVQRGQILQPLLYALACEALHPGAEVESGRLYYCTAAGGYQEKVVPLNDATRKTIRGVVSTIDEALALGFLPAAPDDKACERCDYKAVCGSHASERAAHKPTDDIAALRALREKP